MSKVLIIGAGGVGQVVAHKVSQCPEVFSSTVLASRTVSKCEAIKAQILKRRKYPLETAQVNADDPRAMAALIRKLQPKLVINVALPYQDLSIMDACLKPGWIISTRPITSPRIWPSSNTNGNGLTRIASRKRD